MACTKPECLQGKTKITGVCRVCEINHNDITPKRVKYCQLCSAYICEFHQNEYGERLVAAVKTIVTKFKKKKKDETKVIA